MYVNVERKVLPFKGNFKYTLLTEDVSVIIDQLQKMPCKTAVIDDTTYIMSNTFMRRHRNMRGNAQFDLYNDIADGMWNLFQAIKQLPYDVIVYVILHEDTNDYGDVKIRTIGKLLDSKVPLEGIVTICLRCMSSDGKHFFSTTSDGSDITKSPEQMWDSDKIDNDLKMVDSTIREFYGLDDKGKTQNEQKSDA